MTPTQTKKKKVQTERAELGLEVHKGVQVQTRATKNQNDFQKIIDTLNNSSQGKGLQYIQVERKCKSLDPPELVRLSAVQKIWPLSEDCGNLDAHDPR